MVTMGVMRVNSMFSRYASECVLAGIDVTGWQVEAGRLLPRSEDCRPWRIVGGEAAPGFTPDGIIGRTADQAAQNLLMAVRVLRDLRTREMF